MPDTDLPSYTMLSSIQHILQSVRDEIEKLGSIVERFQTESNKSIKKMTDLTQENGKQTDQMLKLTQKIHSLTVRIAILTFIMLIGLGIQIWLAMK
jgi:hypothetical protein